MNKTSTTETPIKSTMSSLDILLSMVITKATIEQIIRTVLKSMFAFSPHKCAPTAIAKNNANSANRQSVPKT